MRTSAGWMLLAAVMALPSMAQAEKPLSAIDWLSESIGAAAGSDALPAGNGSRANLPPVSGEPAVSRNTIPEPVSTTVLDGPSLDAVGLLAPAVTGLPANLWGIGRKDEIMRAISETGEGDIPELQGLLISLLLAEAEPASDSGSDGALLLARIDRLLDIGALDQVHALIDATGADASPEVFRRNFDVALLTGHEDAACEVLKSSPGLAPTVTTRVFCLARGGDWNAAALTLRTAEALGNVSAADNQLLSHFLDPDLFDGEPLPEPPSPVTPLIWRIYDALGEPIPTASLPLAFSQADLSERAGWKAQIEAAERLARSGAIPPNVLLGLYTERMPAASGGVWDRVDAFQQFDAALAAGDVVAIEQRLPLAYARMRDVELEVPFAALFADSLARFDLRGDAARIAFELGLLSPRYQQAAQKQPPEPDARSRFLAGLALGRVEGLVAPDSMARAIVPAFTTASVPDDLRQLIDQGRIGEAILQAMQRIDSGLRGELVKVSEGLSVLRALGLEDAARQTALQMMILERRG